MEQIDHNHDTSNSTDTIPGTDTMTQSITTYPLESTLSKSEEPILLIYVILMALTSCIGIIGNTLVIVVVITNKKLLVLHNVFIVNLAVADLIVTSLVNPFAIVGALDKGRLFARRPALCEFLATMCITSFTCSIWSISFVSLNRYFYICHRLIYTKLYNNVTVPIMIVGLWVVAFLADLPNFLGWGDHFFDTRNFLCNYNYSHNFTYTRGYLLLLAFITPLGILCYSYLRIYQVARKSSKRVLKKDRKLGRIRAADTRLLKTIALICVTFLIMWTPYSVTVLFHLGHIFWLFIFSSLLAFANSSANFLIYATDRKFRQAYLQIWQQLAICRTNCFKSRRKNSTCAKDSRADTTCSSDKIEMTDSSGKANTLNNLEI